MRYGIKVVGNKNFKDLKLEGYSRKIPYNYNAAIGFETKKNERVSLEIYPYRSMALVDAYLNYEIINVGDIEVRNYENMYHWDRGEHSYYMIANNLSKESMKEIVDGISIKISDEDIVKECLIIRGN